VVARAARMGQEALGFVKGEGEEEEVDFDWCLCRFEGVIQPSESELSEAEGDEGVAEPKVGVGTFSVGLVSGGGPESSFVVGSGGEDEACSVNLEGSVDVIGVIWLAEI